MSSWISITNLPVVFDEFSLKEIFSEIGEIRKCVITKNSMLLKNNGFIQFLNSKSARLAATTKDQTVIGKSAIRVYVIWNQKETLSTIKIGNLPNDVDANELENCFSPFGDIVDVRISKKENGDCEALISYSRVDHALQASKEMKGVIFGANHENLSVDLVNPDARNLKWKRNGFEYSRTRQPSHKKTNSKTPPPYTLINSEKCPKTEKLMNNLSVPQNSPFSTSQSHHFSRQMINSSNEHNKIYGQYLRKHQAKHPSTERCYQLSTPTYSFTRSISPSYRTNVDNNNNVNVSMNNIIQHSPINSVASKSGTPSTISIHSSQSVPTTTPLNSNNMNLAFLPNIKIPSFNVSVSSSPQNEASAVSSLVTISNIFQTPSPLTMSPNFYNTSTISTTPINNSDISNFNRMANNNCDNGSNNIHQNQNNNICNNNNYYYQNQNNNSYHQNQNNNSYHQNQNNNCHHQNQNNNSHHQNQNFNLQFSSANSPTTVPRAILPCQTIENSVVLSQQQIMFNPILNSTCLTPTPLNISSNNNSSSSIGILPSKTPTICEKVPQSSNYNLFDVNENKKSPLICSITTHSPSPNVDNNNNNCKNSYDNENNNISGENSKIDNNNDVQDHNTSSCFKQNWTCEQEKLGNSLYQKLQSKCLSRTGKLVGMMLEEYKGNCNYLNALIEDEKLLFDKIAVLNKILDDSEKIANIN